MTQTGEPADGPADGPADRPADRIAWTILQTPLGAMLLAASDKGVCRLAFEETADDLAGHFPVAHIQPGGAGVAHLAGLVVSALDDPGKASGIPLDLRGTPFQLAVWHQLRRIPAGETRSYAQIAEAIGRPRAVRAVGSANAANPVAVLVPCHRVVRSDGSTGGYAYGETVKRALLHREGALRESVPA